MACVKTVATLLHSASAAISILGNTPSTSSTPPSLASQKAALSAHSTSYFAALSSIEVRLRRQVYALEEAGLIAAGDDRDEKRGKSGGADDRGAGAGGALDVSWLNARASNAAEKSMERHIWAQAAELVKRLDGGNEGAGGEEGVAQKDEVMDD